MRVGSCGGKRVKVGGSCGLAAFCWEKERWRVDEERDVESGEKRV